MGDRFEILSSADVGITGDIPEDADTLEGNALQKARYVYEKTGMACFADDTGLEVRALDGIPGVRSARYAGTDKDPLANMRLLLKNMQGQADRGARFRTVIALILGDGMELIFEGEVKGRIADAPRGNMGFGYDPVFIPQGFDVTFAEMDASAKNAVSHRARAVEKLTDYLARIAAPDNGF